MHPLPVILFSWPLLMSLLNYTDHPLSQPGKEPPAIHSLLPDANPTLPVCNCTITQAGVSYPISSLLGNETAVSFYNYGNPSGSSANTGLELSNGLILFLYEDTNTGIISFFLIADMVSSGSGGSMTFEINCLPSTAFISVQDDPGEFNGVPPLITGSWSWQGCCTDGGVIENIGCSNTINLDLLISNGIDSIVWLTGDIANPTQILLGLTGEAITISCGGGGGVCCPVGLDTEIDIIDATCPDTPNGSIALSPQDGVPAYTYNWSNGATTALNDNLLPGTYMVTVTDAQGCTEELAVTVAFSPGIPISNPAALELCSENVMDFFDLTSVDNIVNAGSGFTVLWFTNPDLTGSIGNPSNYLSGTATVYAVVDNGFCLSEPVPVELEILPTPVANPVSMNACEESNGMATFDLTTVNTQVNTGSGNVLWYQDPNLTDPISDPTAFFSSSATIYAVIDDGDCVSQPVEIELIVDLKPEGDAVDMHLCGDENQEAVFDLTLLEFSISGGNGVVSWYLEADLLDIITSPSAFQTATVTVYAVLFDGICNSDAIPIDLIVDPTPFGNPVTAIQCDDGSGEALFNLWDYASQINGGNGALEWYWDALLTDPIQNPESFLTESTIIFASVDNGTCISDPIPVELQVIESPAGNSTELETCADITGQGLFNLTEADTMVTGGIGNVTWFEDPQGLFQISNPMAYLSTGTTVYAQIQLGICVSELVSVDLLIINSVSANPVQYDVCDEGSGMAVFNLPNIANTISNGTGQVNWFLDSMGTMIIPVPGMFLSGDSTVYANVTAGVCVSDTVPVDLHILSSPVSTGLLELLCGDSSGLLIFNLTTLDTLINGNTGSVLWFGDAALMQSIPDPVNFITGDTSVYAIVSNGACTSPVAEIILSVSSLLSANPVTLEFCRDPGDTILIDLTQSNAGIGGGINQVNWFLDGTGLMSIPSPDSFPASLSQTVYANISDGTCTSLLVPIDLMILDQPISNAFSIKRCGDTNGQITLDLTAVDPIVSNNTGAVTWYADSAQTVGIVNPSTFTSGDTVLYVSVTNGFCTSSVARVMLDIVDSITANTTLVQVCVLDSAAATIDLSLSDFDISGGNGNVYWFTDSLGVDTIIDPTSFSTSGDTLYAIVAADGCVSEIAMVPVEVESSSFPVLTCDFTSIDSVSMLWLPVTSNYALAYAINGPVIGNPMISGLNSFSLGGLGQGDTVTLWVTALFNSICTEPLTSSITCITDVCPPQVLDFPGLQIAYCRDEPPISIQTTPAGGLLTGPGISGDTLYPQLVPGNSATIYYTWENINSGCLYNVSAEIDIANPLVPPIIECKTSTLNSVTFAWESTHDEYEYEYVINHGPGPGAIVTSDTFLFVKGLQEGDEVTLTLWSLGQGPCGNSDTVMVSCFANQCPAAMLDIVHPDVICSDGDTLMLEVLIQGLSGSPDITWAGQGITDPSGIFDPKLTTPGSTPVTVTVEHDGCLYTASANLLIVKTNEASFEVHGTPCLDSTLTLLFNGYGHGFADWHWDFSGAEAVPLNLPFTTDFSLKWDQPGDYLLSLWIDYGGCISDTFFLPVQIEAPLETPIITCVEENYYSVVISWDPVPGATEYLVTSSLGQQKITDNSCTISILPDDTPVNITVEAIGESICGNTSATIQCRTQDYIPPLVFIPDIFSPDGNGINDIFFVQTNLRVTEISAMRIFDRWGNMLFEALQFPPNDATYGWDGTFSGKELNPGVYLYWVEWETVDGDVETRTGDITIIR